MDIKERVQVIKASVIKHWRRIPRWWKCGDPRWFERRGHEWEKFDYPPLGLRIFEYLDPQKPNFKQCQVCGETRSVGERMPTNA